MIEHPVRTQTGRILANPPIIRLIFDDTHFAVVWTILRIVVGLIWINAGLGKLGNPAWMETGDALKKFWSTMVQVPDSGTPPITFGWYRSFIQMMLNNGWYVWFAKLVAIGEVAVGVMLMVGFLVGVAAFLGAMLNFNYLMAGSDSINPVLLIAAILLILAWKTAGYYGLDRFIVPRLGVSWEADAMKIKTK